MNAAAPTWWGVVSALLIFLVGMNIAVGVALRIHLSIRRSLALYSWHACCSLFYCWYVLRFGGDALWYFEEAANGTDSLSLGTGPVVLATRFVTSATGASLAGAFLAFSTVGSVGIILLAQSLDQATTNSPASLRSLAKLLPFLPSASFWSSAVGKEPIAFLAVCLAIWSSTGEESRHLQLASAIGLMTLVRPHIAALLFVALAVSQIDPTRVRLETRVVYIVGLAGFFVIALPPVFQYVGIDNYESIGQIDSYVSERQQYNQSGGGAVDISQLSLPAQLFTYLFRPHIAEARNLFFLIAACESMILVALVGIRFHLCRSPYRSHPQGNRRYLWIYAASSTLVLATTTANLGISVRQRWMVMPVLLYLLVSVGGNRHTPSSEHEGSRTRAPVQQRPSSGAGV